MAKADKKKQGSAPMNHDIAGETLHTTDHDAIRAWAEERGGRPTIVRGTGSRESGLLRIDFNSSDENLEEVSWEDFFAIFDANGLMFVYQEVTPDGMQSRFSRFVNRSIEEMDDLDDDPEEGGAEEGDGGEAPVR